MSVLAYNHYEVSTLLALKVQMNNLFSNLLRRRAQDWACFILRSGRLLSSEINADVWNKDWASSDGGV